MRPVKSAKTERLPVVEQATLYGLFLIMLILVFRKALFNGSQSSFETPIYIWIICIVLTSLVLVLGVMANKEAYRSRIAIIHTVGFVYPAAYAISMLSAASSHYSLYYTAIHFSYAACFLMGALLSVRQAGAKRLLGSLMAVGNIIVIFGLMNWFGDASLWGIFNWSEAPGQYSAVYNDAVLNSGINARLSSVFQYPNSYAALLIGLLVSTLVLAVSTTNRVLIGLYALSLVPMMLSFVLTLSRGAFLVLPIIFLLALPFLKLHRQLMVCMYMAVTCVATLSISSPMFATGTELQIQYSERDSFLAWCLLIAVSGLTAVVCYLIFKFLRTKIAEKLKQLEQIKHSNLFLPVAAALLLIVGSVAFLGNTRLIQWLPDNIQSRIESINWEQASVLQRGTYYRDAINLWSDYPVFGAGGGAWQALYEKYQIKPYTGRQAHNFFLQTLVEIGAVGTLLLCALLAFVLYHFLRSHRRKTEENRFVYLCFFAISAPILIHSLLDFNMSFVFLGAVVFLCLGGMIAANELPPFAFQKRWATGRWPYAYPVVYTVISVLTVAVFINHLSGSELYAKARSNAISGGNVQEILAPLNRAIAKLPHPEYADLKLQILNQLYAQTRDRKYEQEAENLLAAMKEREPHYKPLLFRELQLRVLNGQYEEAAALLESKLNDFPWDSTVYSELAAIHFEYGLQLVRDGQPQLAQSRWDKAFEVLDAVNAKAEELEAFPDVRQQSRNFGLTPDLALSLGQIQFYRGNYEEAAELLSMRLETDFNERRDVDAAVYYLISLRKTGSDDPTIATSLANAFADNIKPIEDQMVALEQTVPIREE